MCVPWSGEREDQAFWALGLDRLSEEIRMSGECEGGDEREKRGRGRKGKGRGEVYYSISPNKRIFRSFGFGFDDDEESGMTTMSAVGLLPLYLPLQSF